MLASARNFVVKQLLMLTIFSLITPCTSVFHSQSLNPTSAQQSLPTFPTHQVQLRGVSVPRQIVDSESDSDFVWTFATDPAFGSSGPSDTEFVAQLASVTALDSDHEGVSQLARADGFQRESQQQTKYQG